MAEVEIVHGCRPGSASLAEGAVRYVRLEREKAGAGFAAGEGTDLADDPVAPDAIAIRLRGRRKSRLARLLVHSSIRSALAKEH